MILDQEPGIFSSSYESIFNSLLYMTKYYNLSVIFIEFAFKRNSAKAYQFHVVVNF